jgi:hypothetical protein
MMLIIGFVAVRWSASGLVDRLPAMLYGIRAGHSLVGLVRHFLIAG